MLDGMLEASDFQFLHATISETCFASIFDKVSK